MKLTEIGKILEAEVIVPGDADLDIKTAFAVDLMSDALAFAKANCLLITGLITPQTIRTAYALDISAIMVCRGKVAPEDAVKVAEELEIPLLRTCYIMFEACGRLYKAGMVGCIEAVNRCER